MDFNHSCNTQCLVLCEKCATQHLVISSHICHWQNPKHKIHLQHKDNNLQAHSEDFDNHLGGQEMQHSTPCFVGETSNRTPCDFKPHWPLANARMQDLPLTQGQQPLSPFKWLWPSFLWPGDGFQSLMQRSTPCFVGETSNRTPCDFKPHWPLAITKTQDLPLTQGQQPLSPFK